MGSLVMLRWVIPVARPYDSPRKVIAGRISPAVRAGGWLWSPDTTHYVSDAGEEAWLTVVTTFDDAADVQDDLGDLLMSPPTLETGADVLLSPGADWYRAALQSVTHVALDVLDAGGRLPMMEYDAFASPADTAGRLIPFLNDTSETYRRACATYESTERFWLAFFRRPPAPELWPSGHWLWNLAG